MTAQTLHPRVQIVWVLRAVLLSALVTAPFAGGAYLGYLPEWAPVGVGAAMLTLTVAHALLRYRRWSYEIREDAIYLDRGVITQVRTTVPLVRIQHVDSRRGPIERTAGLASCVVYTAGSRGADVRIPGLTPDGASDLREELKRLAIRADGEDAV
ncbi:PH domain-containing protein [Halorubrum tebenquichense]|uniref:Membrane-flanked domain protein n=1 Tax=Halorubrum tebenquichense DSM 14210 TaxID=1227485 RepID=M0DVQ5_9EURY|nr:PH domain-containing protein [Halorubrum tebenquichense]ELZ39595.1 membrane-flanked domain protein [Halorubrum tebenquichense DSM 14210]